MNANMPIREWMSGDWRVKADEMLASPEHAQFKTVLRILDGNATSPFGCDHGFATIDTVEDFRGQVPICDAFALRPRINLQQGNAEAQLTSAEPSDYLPGTSPGDMVPLTAHEQQTRARMASCLEEDLDTETGCFSGRVIDLAQLAGRYADQLSPLHYGRHLSDLPDLSQVEDMELRGYLAALMALSSFGVTAIHAPDISAVGTLMKIIDRHRQALFSDLRGETLSVGSRLDPDFAAEIRRFCTVSRARLRTLHSLLGAGRSVNVAALWPSLKTVLTDHSRNCDGSVEAGLALLSGGVKVIDMGCWMNEAILTMPSEIGGDTGLPAAQDVFYEFAATDSEQLLGLHQITKGKAYRVFVTTASGLYRFALPVIAQVSDWSGQFPLLQIRRVAEPTTGRRQPEPDLHQAMAAAQEALDASGTGIVFCRVSEGAAAGHFRLALPGAPLPDCLAARLVALFDTALRARSLYYDRLRARGDLPPVQLLNTQTVRAPQQIPQMTCSIA